MQPAAGDAGTALGAALHVARAGADRCRADAGGADLGRGWTRRASWRRSCAGPRCRTPGRDSIAAEAAPGAGRQRHRRLVPGAQRVRPARARPPLAARPPRRPGHHGPDERRQGPRAVPADRADGAAPTGSRRSSRASTPARTCCSCTGCRSSGGTASRRSCTSTAPPGCRPCTPTTEPLVAEMLAEFERLHRPAGGGQHVAEHGGPADGGHPARGDGAVRLGAGGPAGDRPVRGAPAGGVRWAVTGDQRGGADARPAQPARCCSTRSPRGAGRPTRGAGGRRPAATPPGPLPGAGRVHEGAGRAGRGPGRGAQRRLAGRPRTAGWSFLDDDVVPDAGLGRAGWSRDLDGAGDRVGGVQGRVRVPLPAGRRPTDWERVTAGLAERRLDHRRHGVPAGGAGRGRRLRRAVPAGVPGGRRAGPPGPARPAGSCVRRRRSVTHPVRPEGRWVSLRMQRGNADDALLRRLYGPRLAQRRWSCRPVGGAGTSRSPPPARSPWPPPRCAP